jgi:hypothetical protein
MLNKMLKFKTLKGLVKPAIRQTSYPKSGQHLIQSLYGPDIFSARPRLTADSGRGALQVEWPAEPLLLLYYSRA